MSAIIVTLHAIAGSIALPSYWGAGLSRKGSRLHRASGKVFLLAMLGILATGIPITLQRLARGQTGTAIFLAYLLLILAEACWSGRRAVRLKSNPVAYFSSTYRRVAWVLLACALMVLIYGLLHDSVLLIAFSAVGLIRAASMRRADPQNPRPRWALREHMTAMIANGVGTHISFLNIGLSHLLPESWTHRIETIAWFGPLLVALMAIVWLGRRYGGAGTDAMAAGGR